MRAFSRQSHFELASPSLPTSPTVFAINFATTARLCARYPHREATLLTAKFLVNALAAPQPSAIPFGHISGNFHFHGNFLVISGNFRAPF